MGLPPAPGRGNGQKDGRRPRYLDKYAKERSIEIVNVRNTIGNSKSNEIPQVTKSKYLDGKEKETNDNEVEDASYVEYTIFQQKKDIKSYQKPSMSNMVNIVSSQKLSKQTTLEKSFFKKETIDKSGNILDIKDDDMKQEDLKNNIQWVDGFPILKDRSSRAKLSPGTLDELILGMDPKSMKEICMVWRFYQGKTHKNLICCVFKNLKNMSFETVYSSLVSHALVIHE